MIKRSFLDFLTQFLQFRFLKLQTLLPHTLKQKNNIKIRKKEQKKKNQTRKTTAACIAAEILIQTFCLQENLLKFLLQTSACVSKTR